MKVTLNEDQILQAIADYVGRRMPGATRDDMNIKLHATRGPEGYTSSVEVDPTYVNRNQRPAFTDTGVLGTEAPDATDLVGTVEASETEEPAEATDVEEAPEPEADVAADDSVEQEPEAEAEPEAPAEEPAPEPEPTAEEEAAKPAAKRSIFADMKKPVNSKAEAA